MTNLKVDISKTLNFIEMKEIESLENEAVSNLQKLIDKTGKGNDFLGWVNLPSEITSEIIQDIKNEAEKIRKMAEVYVVVGIGGSYLGSRAVIEALNHNFSNQLNEKDRSHPVVLFAGNNISEDYLSELLEILDKKDYAMTVISKSGTTTEPAIAFRILKNHIEKKYGKAEAVKRIIAVTDKARGALKQLATDEGYKTYDIPDDIGGRFSVLTPVGLLPIAVAGFDIAKLVEGAKNMQKETTENKSIKNNPALLYAITRNILYRKNKTIEILANYQPSLMYLMEWWKQLYGESEGKENKGIIPVSVNFTADLHSMGQYIQEGLRNIFETVISVEQSKKKLTIPVDAGNLDQLNFLSGKRLQEVNKMAELGTMLAHIDGGVPNINISIPILNEESIGELIYFFEIACGISGYILQVNPFDQPGVEAYKKNMFALLGKPGFEKQTEEIKKRL